MKALANQARKDYLTAGRLEYSPSAAKTYKTEVDVLDARLKVAQANAPRERRAQALANSVVKAKIQDNPELANDKEALNKVKRIAINDARASVGASGKATRIEIGDKEWEAIQAGAISDSKLTSILRYADPDAIRARAMPKTTTQLSKAKQDKIASMNASGYTIAEIAESIGVSTSTISSYLK